MREREKWKNKKVNKETCSKVYSFPLRLRNKKTNNLIILSINLCI